MVRAADCRPLFLLAAATYTYADFVFVKPATGDMAEYGCFPAEFSSDYTQRTKLVRLTAPQPRDGCSTLACPSCGSNNPIRGSAVILDRSAMFSGGACTFTAKVKNALDAGAVVRCAQLLASLSS